MTRTRELIILATIFSFITLGTGLQCNTCIASTESDCYNGLEPSFLHQDCEQQQSHNFSLLPSSSLPLLQKQQLSVYPADPIRTVCVRLQYSVLSDIFIRGCGYIYENVDICEYLEEFIDMDGCTSCEHDMCNGSPGFT